MDALRTASIAVVLCVVVTFRAASWGEDVPQKSKQFPWPDSPEVTDLKEQLAAAETKKGKDQPDLVALLMNLGQAYKEQGGYVLATPYVERALSITEKTQGSKHLLVAASLDMLGTLYLLQGDTARARAAYTRAKPILLREFGKDPRYGIFLVHLGELQVLTGETKEAGETVDQAMTAFGTKLSEADHAWTEMNREMGLLFLRVENYQQAEQQLVYALTVRSEALELEEDHDKALFYIASAQNALGEYYVVVGHDDQAEPLLRNALTAYEKKYGNDHPLLGDILVDLAALYDGKGDTSKAREYADRAQALHRKSAGYSHIPDSPMRKVARRIP